MNTYILEIVLCLVTVSVVIEIFLLLRKTKTDLTPLIQAVQDLEKSQERAEISLRAELSQNREEMSNASKQSREELAGTLKSVGDSLQQQLASLVQSTDLKLDRVREILEQRLQAIQEASSAKMDQVREDTGKSSKELRDEIRSTLQGFNDTLVKTISEMGRLQKEQIDAFAVRLDKLIENSDTRLTTMRDTIESRLTAIQEDSGKKLEQSRQDSLASSEKSRAELAQSLKDFRETIAKSLKEEGESQRLQLTGMLDQLSKLTDTTEKKLDAQKNAVDERLKGIQSDSALSAKQMREETASSLTSLTEQVAKLTQSNQQTLETLKTAIEEKLKAIQEDNTKQLDQMRATVDEKLQGTLEKRLGESFKQVSERLEQVHKGLGEMQTLATGVGDLKRVLTNVKTRGTWGEFQLGTMLEQILTPDQYATNVSTKNGGERVEFAIKLPGHGEDGQGVVWLPLDAKFPVEDYQRLLEAQERADVALVDSNGKMLENRIKQCAKSICEKYLNPPQTTDFGILFLPTEGLFAEVIRRIGLTEYVQRECRVVIAGPSTLWSLLNSLQMGFRTLAIQKRSSEVWNLLAAVKTEWTKYGGVLEKVQKKLQEASNTIRDAERRNRAVGRKLQDVQELPTSDAQDLLALESVEGRLDELGEEQ